MRHTILRDKLPALEAPLGLEITLAQGPHVKKQGIINSHCEADGFPPFLPELRGPASELGAQIKPSLPAGAARRGSPCGRTAPPPRWPSHRSAAAVDGEEKH